jgi:hypothetical protein
MSNNIERVGVVVKDGTVLNAILWGDNTYDQLKNEYDHVEETTDWDTRPGIGWTWNKKDGYRPAQPFSSWSYDDKLAEWQAPVKMPEPTSFDNPEPYQWDEETLSWFVPQWWIDQQEEETEPEA